MKASITSSNKKKALSLLRVVILPLHLYGCNTMEGAGTDIKEAGKALEHSAERNKPDEPTRCCPYCLQPIKERRKL